MKKLFLSTKISLLLTLVFSQYAFAAEMIGRIDSVQGNAFVFFNGSAKPAHVGMELWDLSEVVTEEGAQVAVTDYYDHKFVLSGSGHLKFFNRVTELKRGYLWIQSYRDEVFSLQTANTQMDYKRGESIISFDIATGKTQVLVSKGFVTVANLLNTQITTTVAEGQFSFVDNQYNNGIPRKSTPIGFTSYQKITSLFHGVKPMADLLEVTSGKSVDRGVASTDVPLNYSPDTATEETVLVKPVGKATGKVGQIIHRKKTRIKLKTFGMDRYYQEEMKRVAVIRRNLSKPTYKTPSGVAVKIYGKNDLSSRSVASTPKEKGGYTKINYTKGNQSRVPASVELAPQVKIVPNNSFESSLVDEYKNQMRHSKEVNSLINELQNYDQDYKIGY